MPEPLSPFRRLVLAEPGTVRIEVHRVSEPSLWAVIDVEDWDLIGQHRWRVREGGSTPYAIAVIPDIGTRGMHQLILPTADGLEADHIDRDGLNNRRSNLRVATRTQNLQNRRSQRTWRGRPSTSQYKGVSRITRGRGWQANITVNGKREYLGRFATEVEGARAYDQRAREAFGEFALLNFPEDLAS